MALYQQNSDGVVFRITPIQSEGTWCGNNCWNVERMSDNKHYEIHRGYDDEDLNQYTAIGLNSHSGGAFYSWSAALAAVMNDDA